MGRLTKLDKQILTGLGALLAVSLCAGVLSAGDADPPRETRATDTAADRAQALSQTRPPGTTAPQEKATTPQEEATEEGGAAEQEGAAEPTPSAKPKPKPEPTATKTKTAKKTKPKPKPRPTKTKTKPAEVYYANCAAVRAAGADPIRAGDPGYSRKLDRDGDGVGCE